MVYQVKLSNVGNPDRRQDHTRELPGTPKGYWRDVATLAEASAACRAYICETELGAGNWAGGQVRDAQTREVVARVSYNGRVWDLDGKEIDTDAVPGAKKSPACGM